MTDSPRPGRWALWFVMLSLAIATTARAESPRVLPTGQLPHDCRLGELTNLNGYFPMRVCPTLEAWAERSERLHRQLLVATGVWPMPTKTPAHAVIHGRVDRDDYTVEKVFFQSFPGHFVTGNLYRPKGRGGRLPGVLCPHGHWANGRFYDAGPDKVKKEIAAGAEKFEIGGRYPLQARCVQLARMGCVVFHYDMVGYADSVQLAHRPGNRAEMNTPQNWGYFSPQAEIRQQNMMGLQTYNSVRALDWFGELPDVDPDRIAVTGASGGGTQTFVLCAVDRRPAVAFPAVMVSTAMQGGCTCENACYLRVNTGNIELAALISPRPLGMSAADDWTKEIATKGLPELKQHYKMLGIEDRVMAAPFVQFPHNYNSVSRAVMYDWMNQHLKLGAAEPIVEQDFKPLSIAEMSVWDDKHPKPPSEDADHERALLRWITTDSDLQMDALVPSDAKSLAEYRRVIGGAVDVMIGRRLTDVGEIAREKFQTKSHGDWQLETFLLRNAQRDETVPAICLRPKKGNGRTVLWITPTGKGGLLDADGSPLPAVKKLLAAGVAVVGLDLIGQGEFTADGKPLATARLNNSGRDKWAQYAGYTFGYNHSTFAQRVHDILSAVAYFSGDEGASGRVDLVGLSGAGHWVTAARAQAGEAVGRAAIDTAGFRFAALTAIDDPDFLPGGAKYLDLPGMIALSAPQELWLAGEEETPKVVQAAYRAAAEPGQLSIPSDGEKPRATAAAEWLLR